MPGVEISLRADPHAISNPRGPVESALDIGLCADEHAIADLECLKMFEADGRADTHSVAEFPGDRSPDRAAHQGVEFSFAIREPVILLDQRFRAVERPEVSG